MLRSQNKSGVLQIYLLLLILPVLVSVSGHHISLNKWRVTGHLQPQLGKPKHIPNLGFIFHLPRKRYDSSSHLSPVLNEDEKAKHRIFSTHVQTERKTRTKRSNSDSFGNNYLTDKLRTFTVNQWTKVFLEEAVIPPRTLASSNAGKVTDATSNPREKSPSRSRSQYFNFLDPKLQRKNDEGYICHFKLCHTRPYESGRRQPTVTST